jgi:hypothetical protein
VSIDGTVFVAESLGGPVTRHLVLVVRKIQSFGGIGDEGILRMNFFNKSARKFQIDL